MGVSNSSLGENMDFTFVHKGANIDYAATIKGAIQQMGINKFLEIAGNN